MTIPEGIFLNAQSRDVISALRKPEAIEHGLLQLLPEHMSRFTKLTRASKFKTESICALQERLIMKRMMEIMRASPSPTNLTSLDCYVTQATRHVWINMVLNEELERLNQLVVFAKPAFKCQTSEEVALAWGIPSRFGSSKF